MHSNKNIKILNNKYKFNAIQDICFVCQDIKTKVHFILSFSILANAIGSPNTKTKTKSPRCFMLPYRLFS